MIPSLAVLAPVFRVVYLSGTRKKCLIRVLRLDEHIFCSSVIVPSDVIYIDLVFTALVDVNLSASPALPAWGR